MGSGICASILLLYSFDFARMLLSLLFFFFSSRRRHTRCSRDWSSDVCSSDLTARGHYRPRVTPRGVRCLTTVVAVCRRFGAVYGPTLWVTRHARRRLVL